MSKIQTDKQRKLLQLISANVGLAKPKTLYEMLLEAGYEETTARQQSGILGGIREELDPIVQKLEEHRLKVIARLAVKLDAATYRDLTDSLDKLTKNIQLLSGKATERPNNVITGLEHLTDEQLRDFIAEELLQQAKALVELDRRRKENPLRYCRQHPKQIEASAADQKIRALFWGNRVGKTEWGAQEVAKVALGEHGWIQPGEIWSFSPSFDEQKDTTQKKLLSYIPEHRILDRSWIRKGILKELVIDAGNGRVSKIAFKSYEQGREKAQGAGKVLIWFDEEPPKDIFDECSVRTEAGIELYMILTMTPVKGMTWVYNELYLNTSNPDVFVSEASWNDNPFLTEDQKNQMRRRLTKQALLVREQGKFMKQVGLVCSWFTRSVHVIEMGELPPGDTLFGLDFGFSNPAAGLWVRIDREFNWWIFDGFYRRGLTNPDIQAIIKLKEQGLGRVIRIGDSAQASDIKQLCDAGIKIEGVEKETGTSKENWDEWRARLMEEQGRIQEGTGKPKIFISSRLVDLDPDGNEFNFLVKEIENLRWEEMKTDLGIEQKPTWGKQPNHAIDALSYLLAKVHKPMESAPMPGPTIGLVKPFPGLGG